MGFVDNFNFSSKERMPTPCIEFLGVSGTQARYVNACKAPSPDVSAVKSLALQIVCATHLVRWRHLHSTQVEVFPPFCQHVGRDLRHTCTELQPASLIGLCRRALFSRPNNRQVS